MMKRQAHRQRLAAGLQANISAEGIGTNPYHFGRFHQDRMYGSPAPELGLHVLILAPFLPVALKTQSSEFFVQPVAISLVRAGGFARITSAQGLCRSSYNGCTAPDKS